jgi:hypothetical protein
MTQFCAPENTSLLNPNEFRFFLHRAPYLTFFVQTVKLPDISLEPVKEDNPFTTLNVPGDHIIWDTLPVTFLVDEDLRGWQEMYHWMRGMGFPATFDEYKAYKKEIEGNGPKKSIWEAMTSDISVFTNTGHKNLNIEFLFQNGHPIRLTAPKLDTTNPDQPVVTSTCTFAYTLYDVKSVKTS